MIYAIQAIGTDFIKIGTSTEINIRDRLGMLQTGCPYELHILAVGEGGRKDEQAIHAALKAAKCHHSREWFVDSIAVRQAVSWINDRKKQFPKMPSIRNGRKRLERITEYAQSIDLERKVKTELVAQTALSHAHAREWHDELQRPLLQACAKVWIDAESIATQQWVNYLRNQYPVSADSSSQHCRGTHWI